MASDSPRAKIWLATMIDQLCAAATNSSVKHAASADPKEIDPLGEFARPPYLLEPLQSLALRNSLPRVLYDLSSARDVLLCEHTKSMDGRAPDAELKMREAGIKSRVFR